MISTYKLKFVIGIILGILVLPVCVFAHASGVSFELKQGQLTIDQGYDPSTFSTGESTVFDFFLKDSSSGSEVAYASVWVRILKDDSIQYAAGLKRATLGRTTLLFVPQIAGSYTLAASYRDSEDNEIASSSFPFIISQGEEGGGGTSVLSIISAVVGVIIGFFANVLLRFVRGKKLFTQ